MIDRNDLSKLLNARDMAASNFDGAASFKNSRTMMPRPQTTFNDVRTVRKIPIDAESLVLSTRPTSMTIVKDNWQL